jgi:hypothetical protein
MRRLGPAFILRAAAVTRSQESIIPLPMLFKGTKSADNAAFSRQHPDEGTCQTRLQEVERTYRGLKKCVQYDG